MALTVRKKKGLIIPKSPTLILPNSVFGSTNQTTESKIIEKTIKLFIHQRLGVSNRSALKRVIFFPVYRVRFGEKEITKIYMQYLTRKNTIFVDVEEIEGVGVSLVEFFDYIITAGAKELQDPESALNIM